MTYISVVGAGEADGTLYEQARKVGRLVAERGGIVVCGGLGGVMEAASRGASEAGGVAVGILSDEDRGQANRFLSYSISAGAGQARNLAVACSGEAVVAVGGEYGTLSEIGFAKKVGRVGVALSSWELGEHVISASSPEGAESDGENARVWLREILSLGSLGVGVSYAMVRVVV